MEKLIEMPNTMLGKELIISKESLCRINNIANDFNSQFKYNNLPMKTNLVVEELKKSNSINQQLNQLIETLSADLKSEREDKFKAEKKAKFWKQFLLF